MWIFRETGMLTDKVQGRELRGNDAKCEGLPRSGAALQEHESEGA
jgi:hypothetical protein